MDFDWVDWYCDNCDDYLNDQPGFDEKKGVWTCRKCGYRNQINKKNIKKYMDEYGDEHDNADYEKGYPSYPNENRAYDTGKIIGEGIAGLVNGIISGSSREIIDEYEAYEDDEYDDDDDDYDDDEDYEDAEDDQNYDNSEGFVKNYSEIIGGSGQSSNSYQKEKTKSDNKKNVRTIAIIVFAFLSLLVILNTLLYSAKLKESEIKVDINSKDCKGINYSELESKFKNMGFTNVKTIPKKDLITGWKHKDGDTEKVTINNKKFKSGDIFSKDSEVVITYHTFKKK